MGCPSWSTAKQPAGGAARGPLTAGGAGARRAAQSEAWPTHAPASTVAPAAHGGLTLGPGVFHLTSGSMAAAPPHVCYRPHQQGLDVAERSHQMAAC
jgi:hypothetical protein